MGLFFDLLKFDNSYSIKNHNYRMVQDICYYSGVIKTSLYIWCTDDLIGGKNK